MASGVFLLPLGLLAALALLVHATGGGAVLCGAVGCTATVGLGTVPGGHSRRVQGMVCGWDLHAAHHPCLPGGARATPPELHAATPPEAHHQVHRHQSLIPRMESGST